MLPVETGELALQYGPESAPTVLAGAEPGNVSAGYVPVHPGRYKLNIVRTSAAAVPLHTMDLSIPADAYITILAQRKHGLLSVEVLDDTFDRAKATTGRLTIRNFLAEPQATVTAGTRKVGPLAEGAVEVFDGLALEVVMLQMTAKMSGSRNREWSMEVDLRSCPRVSLLLLLDSYGRFRPRLSPCGQMELTEPEPPE